MTTDYTYTALKDVKADSQIYHVWGVVKYFREPRRTRGPDWNMTVIITDESLGSDGKITFNLFLKDASSFPALCRPGAIVRFHRVKFTLHNGQLQGLISPGFSALVFENDSSEPKGTKRNYTFSDKDKFRLNQLRKWSENFVTKELKSLCKKINEIRPNQFFDLHCQVIGEVKMTDSHVVLKVWDGTVPDASVQIVKTVENTDKRVQYDQVTYPHVKDYLVDVSVYDDHVQEADSILLGDYVTFCNLRAFVPIPFREDSGEVVKVELCLHQGSSYGRSLKAMDDDAEAKLRESLNLILQSVNGNSHSVQEAQSASARTSRTGREKVDIIDLATSAVNTSMTMNAVQNIAAYRSTISATSEPVKLECLFPRLSELSDDISVIKVYVDVEAVPDNVTETVVLFCGHCHFLSSLPTKDGNYHLSGQRLKSLRRNGVKVKKGLEKEKNGRVRKPETKYCSVPLADVCRTTYSIKNLKLSPSAWLEATTPCLDVPGMTLYKCPSCSGKENDPCVLSYKFCIDMLLHDRTGNIRVVMFENRLCVDDVTISARDVVMERASMGKYVDWLKKLCGKNDDGGCKYEATIRIQRKKSVRRNNGHLYQLLKLSTRPNS